MSRLAVPVALLLMLAATSDASAEVYCRIYKTMTIGDGSASFYCLRCPTCDNPTGMFADHDASVGGCDDCTAENCVEVIMAQLSAAQKAKTAEPLKDEPSVLYDPDITKRVRKWRIAVDITPDNEIDDPVTVFLVTAKVKPKKPGGGYYPSASLGFGRQIDKPAKDGSATDVVQVKPGVYRFKFKESPLVTHEDCIALIDD